MAEKIPATGKWEGGTEPVKSPGRLAGEQLGDMEFGQAVAPYMDPEDRKYIKPEQAKLVGVKEPVNTAALNTTQATKDHRRGISRKLHPEGKDELVFKPGHVYAMHAQDAQPTTWAHEFRHNSEKLNSKRNEEIYNRYEDMHHALTDYDEKDAHEYLRDVMIRRIQDSPDAEVYANITTVADLDKVLNKIKPALQQQVQAWHDNDRQGSIGKHMSRLVEEHLESEASGPPDEHKKPMEGGE